MYFSYIQKLTTICTQRHFRLEVLSLVGKKNEYPLYKVTSNGNEKKTICFSAGIHGDEISGPFAVLKFLKTVDFKKPNTPKIILFPVANPTGFHAGIVNRNFQNFNLNRHFRDKEMRKENKTLYNAIKKEHLQCFMSLHEDDVHTGAYLHAYMQKKVSTILPRNILKNVNRSIPIWKKSRVFSMRANDGLIVKPKPDGSFEERMHHDGVPYSFCLEVPYITPLNLRVQANVAAMKTVLAEYQKLV